MVIKKLDSLGGSRDILPYLKERKLLFKGQLSSHPRHTLRVYVVVNADRSVNIQLVMTRCSSTAYPNVGIDSNSL